MTFVISPACTFSFSRQFMMEESQAVEQLLRCKQSIMSEGKQSERESKRQAVGIWLMGFLQQIAQL